VRGIEEGSPGETEIAEAEFAGFPCVNEGGAGGAGFGCEEEPDGDENCGDDKNEALDDARPDDGFHAADHGIENGEAGDGEDDGLIVPAGHDLDGNRGRDDGRADIEHAVGDETRRRVHATAEAEARADIFVGAHADNVAVERHDILRDEDEDERKRAASEQQDESLFIRGRRMGDERVAADERGHHRHGDGPRWHGTAGDEIILDGSLTAGNHCAQGGDAEPIKDEHEIIQEVQAHGGAGGPGGRLLKAGKPGESVVVFHEITMSNA
jgi:hypothetical protein